MNYKLEQTPDGPRWIKQIWNEKEEKIENIPLEIGESITFNPKDFVGDTSVFLFKDQTKEVMTHPDDTPFTWEEFIAHIEQTVETKKFEPCAFYNKAGDLLEIFWEDDPSYVDWLNSTVEVSRSMDDSRARIVGAKVWGIKKILLQAYANCDKPEKYVSLPALNPYHQKEDDKENNGTD